MSSFPVHKQWEDYSYPVAADFPFHVKLLKLLDRHFTAHRHDFLEFSLVVDGEGYQLIDGQRYPMGRGTLMFLLPYQIQEMITLSNRRLLLYNCMFDLQFLTLPGGTREGLEELLAMEPSQPPSIQLSKEQFQTAADLFANMTDEFNGNRTWRRQLIQAKLWELLILFDRLRGACGETPPPPKAGGPSIWPVIRYVHLHYREPISLSVLSGLFGMSHSYWSRSFKEHLGQNFTDFLHEVRIRHACSLLDTSDLSVLDISLEVGFGSIRTFLRSFQQIKGMTPTEYRRSRR